tara:strand:+ start:13814 stop:14545 length:732 start_codon:yes stop_codon:yes gene_type:complete
MERILKHDELLKKQELKFKNSKYVIGLKYDNIHFKLTIVQISVIFASTCIAFIKTLEDTFNISSSLSTIIPIVLSTYTALVIAISRFYRLEDIKEGLSKLFERHAFIINRIKHKRRLIHLYGPWTEYDVVSDVEKMLNTLESDGLEEVVTQSMQDMDIMIPYSERLYFENILVKMHIDKKVLKDNLSKLDVYENNLNLYKQKVSILRYYLCCLWSGSNYTINEERTFDEVQRHHEKNMADNNT